MDVKCSYTNNYVVENNSYKMVLTTFLLWQLNRKRGSISTNCMLNFIDLTQAFQSFRRWGPDRSLSMIEEKLKKHVNVGRQSFHRLQWNLAPIAFLMLFFSPCSLKDFQFLLDSCTRTLQRRHCLPESSLFFFFWTT